MWSKKLNYINFLCLAFFLLNSKNANGVNILSWWGYLDKKPVRKILKEECGVRPSIDEYYSNTEFLRRFESGKDEYDIIIYSHTVYSSVKESIAAKKEAPTLQADSKFYHPSILEKLQMRDYPLNTTFFLHSLTGFLVNEKSSWTEKNLPEKIFALPKGQLAIFMDDPVEVSNLADTIVSTKASKKSNLESLFDSLSERQEVLITNDFEKLTQRPNFGFAYTWSGNAIYSSKQNDIKFLIPPNATYITSDLISILSKDELSTCVAKALVSKEVAKQLELQIGYISSYIFKDGAASKYAKVYGSDLHKKISSMKWLKAPSQETLEKVSNTWKRIKLNLSKAQK